MVGASQRPSEQLNPKPQLPHTEPFAPHANGLAPSWQVPIASQHPEHDEKSQRGFGTQPTVTNPNRTSTIRMTVIWNEPLLFLAASCRTSE